MSRQDEIAYLLDLEEAAQPCGECAHPASHHDAGECWTAPDGSETMDDPDDRCNCYWFQASEVNE